MPPGQLLLNLILEELRRIFAIKGTDLFLGDQSPRIVYYASGHFLYFLPKLVCTGISEITRELWLGLIRDLELQKPFWECH